MEDKKMEDALDLFVKSLEEEEKSGRLVEESIREEQPNAECYTGLEKIAEMIKKTIEAICIAKDIRVETDKENYKVSVYGEDLGIAIGKNGKNIDALEYIINLIATRKNLLDRNIIIDIKDYRKNRIEKVKKKAMKMAEKAIKEGKKIRLKPMCAFERKIIHSTLAGFKNIKTISKNKEPNRSIIIYPTN